MSEEKGDVLVSNQEEVKSKKALKKMAKEAEKASKKEARQSSKVSYSSNMFFFLNYHSSKSSKVKIIIDKYQQTVKNIVSFFKTSNDGFDGGVRVRVRNGGLSRQLRSHIVN